MHTLSVFHARCHCLPIVLFMFINNACYGVPSTSHPWAPSSSSLRLHLHVLFDHFTVILAGVLSQWPLAVHPPVPCSPFPHPPFIHLTHRDHHNRSRVAGAVEAVRQLDARRRQSSTPELGSASAAEVDASGSATPAGDDLDFAHLAAQLATRLGAAAAADPDVLQREIDLASARRDQSRAALAKCVPSSTAAELRRQVRDAEDSLSDAQGTLEQRLRQCSCPPAAAARLEEIAEEIIACEDNFAASLAAGDVCGAARIAARAPARTMQTATAWKEFEVLGTAALFEYACALVDAGTSPELEEACATVVCNAGRLDVLESWVLSGLIVPSLQLAITLKDMCDQELRDSPDGSRRFHELACLTVAVCERVGDARGDGAADGIVREMGRTVFDNTDATTTTTVDATLYAQSTTTSATTHINTSSSSATIRICQSSGNAAAVRIAMELLIRRGRLRAAVHFGASRGATVADCAAVAAKTGSVALGSALGRAAARGRASLDAVAALLPPAGESLVNELSVGMDGAASTTSLLTVDYAMLAAFAKELIDVCVEEMA